MNLAKAVLHEAGWLPGKENVAETSDVILLCSEWGWVV
jgi:hypothetical protein